MAAWCGADVVLPAAGVEQNSELSAPNAASHRTPLAKPD
eukprot:CAMPEP_0173392160 /NCGR_PEP_ID=MMETSP1356-20130122/18795_1 /TAXON_ID=77927 ORGANISM="Hemiselmis virescens, Strain PCC157" /NCGR_SAMPLE_ID=MMETSP1356 /ASSEMBLY_ACC=CAM_ASM_000847 /LENGTH=38 /DNA_ID= /DNA_START= /DNA_END= /DNA_ORIENTATION=